MAINRNLRRKTASTHGLIVGAVLIFVALFVWLTRAEGQRGLQLLNWGVIIGSVYVSMKTWRDKYCDGIISYNQALAYGIRVMFFASIIFAVYNVLYFNVLEPESVEQSMDIIEDQFYALGYDEERIQASVEMARSMQTPIFQAITTIVGTSFLGLLVSLVVALFIRREGDPFQTVMRDVHSDNDDNIKLNE